MFTYASIINFLTIIWCLTIGILHLTPDLRDKWGKLIDNNSKLHTGVGVFVVFLGVLNFLKYFFK